MFKMVNKRNEGETLLSSSKVRYIFCADKFYNTSFFITNKLYELCWRQTKEINEIFSKFNKSWACFFESIHLRYLCITISLFWITSPNFFQYCILTSIQCYVLFNERNKCYFLLITDLNHIYNKAPTIFIDLVNCCKYAKNDSW